MHEVRPKSRSDLTPLNALQLQVTVHSELREKAPGGNHADLHQGDKLCWPVPHLGCPPGRYEPPWTIGVETIPYSLCQTIS